MLSDEDKKDVVENIDSYSLDDIEGKLSIICVRNKVNFNLEDEKEAAQGMFSLNNLDDDDGAPAWIKAVRETKNKI
jgi:type II secretory pathway component PulK